MWTTLDSWSRRRRVIGKAECTTGDPNPRFVVTSLKPQAAEARYLYETVYCARGEMENRIKERQLDLFADRTSSHTMRANQLRLWFASMAYVLICALRRIGLAHTQFAAATCGTIRLALLKIGALVRISVRRIHLAMASGCPWHNPVAERIPIGPPTARRLLTNQKSASHITPHRRTAPRPLNRAPTGSKYQARDPNPDNQPATPENPASVTKP